MPAARGEIHRRPAPRIAADQFPIKCQGGAWQRAAFARTDLLPVYGSSELELQDPYHPANLFKEYPSGFTIFPMGKTGRLPVDSSRIGGHRFRPARKEARCFHHSAPFLAGHESPRELPRQLLSVVGECSGF